MTRKALRILFLALFFALLPIQIHAQTKKGSIFRNKYKEENKELKATLSKVKSALQEALMVNVNLGKVTKLFLENTTTQKEKVEIINRFNEAKTIDQSNALYESIKRELNKGAKQNVMLESKSLDVKGSAINENKIYESQDLLDIKNFMSRMDKC